MAELRLVRTGRPAAAHLIAASLLGADFARLGEEVRAVEAAGADCIHVDVMDQHFVPDLAFSPAACKALRPHTRLPIDVHLMTMPVDPLVGAFADAGAASICFHPEATLNPLRTLALIRGHGCRVGVALNPATPVSWLDHLLPELDFVVLMSTHPGFADQKFIASTLPKVAAVHALISDMERDSGKRPRLYLDGGINTETAMRAAAAGADAFVAGPTIFGRRDYQAAIAVLRAAAEQGNDTLRAASAAL